MKKQLSILFLLLCAAVASFAQDESAWKALERDVNFYIANDLGRNGYYDQKTIAETMGRMAEAIDIECVCAPGDVHHFEGVRSVSDPLWMTNYELIYSHPELMLPWYATLGNHEYRGNTQAVLDYAGISARWQMPARYYTKVLADGETTVRLVFLDTTPMMDKYRRDTEKYPDAYKEDWQKQLDWLDATLRSATEDWVIVLGHHPIYADTPKDDTERADMQARLDPVLKRHKNVSMYVCGHIHNFQHIRTAASSIDYVVNTSGSLSRPNVQKVEGTQFCSGISGFSLVCADKTNLYLYLIDKNGNVAYTIHRTKNK